MCYAHRARWHTVESIRDLTVWLSTPSAPSDMRNDIEGKHSRHSHGTGLYANLAYNQCHVTASSLLATPNRRVFEDTHRPLTDQAWSCATLPLRQGGLGLTLTSLLADICYASSLLSIFPLAHGLISPLCIHLEARIGHSLDRLRSTFLLPHPV